MCCSVQHLSSRTHRQALSRSKFIFVDTKHWALTLYVLGVIRQILTHHAYMLNYLAGAPSKVISLKSIVNYAEYKEEQQAALLLQMGGKHQGRDQSFNSLCLSMKAGCIAHLFASFTADDHTPEPWTCYTKVIGSKGGGRFNYSCGVL